MIVTRQEELDALRAIGAIVARCLQRMRSAAEPGMSTRELDDLARAFLEQEGALSAPESCYNFPGATCISVNEEVAHGIPGSRLLQRGDLINIDVSASKDGWFADAGLSFLLPPGRPALETLCADGERALRIGLAEVRAGAPLKNIGLAVSKFTKARGYTLIRNLASHGVGLSLHEEPEEIPTWPDKHERRVIKDGAVLTVEPFVSLGAQQALLGDDGWTLYADPAAPTVQFEHTVVATPKGPIILTRA